VSAKAAPSTPKVSAKASPAKSPKEVVQSPANVMAFEEGDEVMAKWPGTALFFKSKVTYVRSDDNEYDIQFEDGTVYTLKAKEVRKTVKVTASKTERRRSRSRGRSPARKTAESPEAPKKPATPKVVKAPKQTVTPTRQSARIAAAAAAFSEDDETDGKKAIPKPSKTSFLCKLNPIPFVKSLSFEWVGALFMMALFPLILVSLHTLCTKTSCKPVLPFDKLPKTLEEVWDPQAFLTVVGFTLVLRVLSFIPLGSKVTTSTGATVRMNGFLSLLTLLALMPAVVYRKIDLSLVQTKYFYLMTSSLILGAVISLLARLLARFKPGAKANINPKGNTGNLIVDFFHGREFNPSLLGQDLKLLTFRFSMIGLATINVAMVVNDIMAKGGKVNPLIVMASAFQVIYSLDAVFFEEYFFFSHDAMNTGFGFSLVSSYNSFPFLPTLITKYLIERQPVLAWYYLVGIGLLNALGYIIFRASETQRCEFAKDPSSAKPEGVLETTGGRKLLVSGWWGLVRHPNYLGEILIQWSWVLPAVGAAGKIDLLVYYLPIFTTLCLLMRCRQQNDRNKKKHGTAWATYCERVPANLIPKIY
jgi:protein-S-isoprenylcysteine O-methyltransferase Ste14